MCGLKSKLLLPEFEQFINEHHILGIGETKLCEDDVIQFPGYTFFSKFRKRCIRKSGGLGIFVRNDLLSYIDLIEIDSEYLMVLKISRYKSNCNNDLFITFVYLPPEGSDYSNSDSITEIEQELLPIIENSKYFYFMGDCNARVGAIPEYNHFNINHSTAEHLGIDDDVIRYLNNVNELSSHGIPLTRNSSDKSSNNFGHKLLQFCKNNNLYICNGRCENDRVGAFTTTRGSVIDYLISNLEGILQLESFTVYDYSPFLSDIHSALTFTFNMCIKNVDTAKNTKSHKIWESAKKEAFANNIDRNSVREIKQSLESIHSRFNKKQLEDILQQIKTLFVNSAKRSFKKHTVISTKVRHTKPWFGLQCRKAQKRYYLARRNNFIQKNESSKRRLVNSCKKYKSTVKKYHNKYIKKIQQDIRKLSNHNPKDYWRLINSINKKRDETPIEMETLLDYFRTINADDPEDQNVTAPEPTFEQNRGSLEDTALPIPPSALNDPISLNEIISAIKTLKANKSSGIDEIINEYITSTTQVMLPIYELLFNVILDSGFIPEDWTKGIIVPIYKNKGNKRDPSNYRPITLLSCLGKLFTCILNNRLSKYMEDNKLMSEIQSGFRKQYSTVDNIFILYALLEFCKSKKTKLYCCFVDFTKAFDNIWRIGLWGKLLKSGIEGKILNVIKNMYADVKSCILVNGATSGYFKCEKGVRQGENLSPLLFSIYLNDVETTLFNDDCNGININISDDTTELMLKLLAIFYADDAALMSDNPEHFQYLLHKFGNYCKRWRLKINTAKTKIMILGGNSRSNNTSFTIEGETIEIVKEFKYLGVLFTQNGRFIRYLKYLSEVACKAMYLLRKRTVNLHLPIDCQLKLFDQTIVPILLYGCELSGFENQFTIEKIHLDFLRSVLKMKKSTPHVMIYGEFGRFPLDISIKVRMINYWSKLITGKEDKLSYKMYNVLLYLHRNNIYSSKWIICIQNILQSVGLHYVWIDNHVYNIKSLCNEVKNRLECQFIQVWNSDVYNSSKCINYRIFKTEFNLEKYITELSPKIRITLAKFRTTNNRLPIEKGRWENIERNQRYCHLCNNNSVGDEYHYLFECAYFTELRKLYLPRYYIRSHSTYKFAKLMSSSNMYLLSKVGEFISYILKKFL